MISTDKEALMCDLAETYHIFSMHELPARQVAMYAVGLRANSRIKLAMTGQKASNEEVLLAMIADRLSLLVWFKTKDGQDGTNRPKSMLALLLGEDGPNEDKVGAFKRFATGDDFIKYRKKLLGGE